MITLDQILAAYPENLRAFKESILKEYLQYKILNSIFNSEYASKLAFLGGTALRIVYGSTRFSEDLDFDNFALSEREFTDLSKIIQKYLTLEGLDVEVNTVPQHFEYEVEKPLLNKFDVFTQINAVPKGLLLAQKIFASVNRKRTMGRDFFDIVFLHGIGAQPDFVYLKKNIGIDNREDLKRFMLEKTASMNFEDLARDVEPLLFDPRDKKKVLLFREFVEKSF